MCEKWRNRSEFISEDTFCDVYDGKVWKELQYINRIPFLALPHNFCLMMNVNWFNPFDETQYSAGAIYMVIQNLPRAQRYKFDNLKKVCNHLYIYLYAGMKLKNLLVHVSFVNVCVYLLEPATSLVRSCRQGVCVCPP